MCLCEVYRTGEWEGLRRSRKFSEEIYGGGVSPEDINRIKEKRK